MEDILIYYFNCVILIMKYKIFLINKNKEIVNQTVMAIFLILFYPQEGFMSGSFVAHYTDTTFSIKRDTEARKIFMPGTDINRLYDIFLRNFLREIENMRPSIKKILSQIDYYIKEIEPKDFFLPDITLSDNLSDITKYPIIVKIPVRPQNCRGVYILEIILKKKIDIHLIKEIQKKFFVLLEEEKKKSNKGRDFSICLEDYPFPYVTSFNEMYAIKIESLYRTKYTDVSYYKKHFRYFIENELKPILDTLIRDSTFERETGTKLVPLRNLFIKKKGEYPEDLIDFKNEIIIKQTGFSTSQYIHYATRMNVIIVLGIRNIQKGKLWYKISKKIEMIFNEKKDIINSSK